MDGLRATTILHLSLFLAPWGCTTKWKARVYRWLIVQSLRLDPPFCSALCRFSIFVSVLGFYSECPRALALYNAKTLAPANHFYRMSGKAQPLHGYLKGDDNILIPVTVTKSSPKVQCWTQLLSICAARVWCVSFIRPNSLASSLTLAFGLVQ